MWSVRQGRVGLWVRGVGRGQDILVLRRAVWHAYLAGDNDMNVLDGWRGDFNVPHALREGAHPALRV